MDFMKKISWLPFVLVCGLVTSCATSKGALQPVQSHGPNANMATVSVKRSSQVLGSVNAFNIYIDDTLTATVGNGEEARFNVPNGAHAIRLKPAIPLMLSSKTLNFTAASNVISFEAKTELLGIELTSSDPTVTTVEANRKPASRQPPAASTEADGVESTLIEAVGLLMAKIPPKSKVAIVNVAASDPEISEFIAGELEFIMVDNGLTVIDRSELDRIRREQSFQMSGEVDDSQAVSIGKLAGANVIITGAVTGSDNLRRLRLRALSTETGQVLAVTSEKF